MVQEVVPSRQCAACWDVCPRAHFLSPKSSREAKSFFYIQQNFLRKQEVLFCIRIRSWSGNIKHWDIIKIARVK